MKPTFPMFLAMTVIFGAVSLTSARPSSAPTARRVATDERLDEPQEKSDKKDPEAHDLYKKGKGLELDRQWKEAVEVYRRAVQLQPNFASAYNHLGWCYAALGKFDQALEAHQQGLLYAGVKLFNYEVKPTQAHYAIGSDLYNLGRYDEALAAYERALKFDSKNKDALYELGRTRIAQGNREEATKIAERLPEYHREALMTELSYFKPYEKSRSNAGPKIEESGPSGAPPDPGAPRTPNQITQKPTILYKEKATYTAEARHKGVQGTIILSLIFMDDGSIRQLRVIKGLPYGLNGRAIIAAYKIRFQPAVKNGQPISVRGNLEYTFNLY
ncbi:MAG TPA: TonB family protein [Blastocatellia bacterium]|nr:TonB family protein [Blastocatellia bacterium]